jgi:uncharacterized membrane protein YfcA
MDLIADPLFYALAIPAVILTGASKVGLGGVGAFAVPLMALVIAPQQAAAIMLPILCLIDLVGLWVWWGKWDRVNMRILMCAAVVGIGFGALTFRYLDADSIRLMIGLIATIFAGRWFWKKWRRMERPAAGPSVAKGGFWGAMSGFTSFVSHAGSPPFSVYMLPQKLDKSLYQATSVGFFALVNYVKLLPYWWLGQFTEGNLGTAAVLLPVAIVGALIGKWLHHKIPERGFYEVVHAFLFAVGVKLIWDGVAGMVA